MENKILEKATEFYFMVIAVLMYYFLNEYIDMGLYVTYRHAFALVILASGVILFLYKPDIPKALVVFREACFYSIPLLVTTIVSLFIWLVGMADVEVISRGLSTSFVYTNTFSFALAAGVILYVFGKNGIWYNLIAILIANILVIIIIIAQNGFANYFSEFITLIVTFADETGDIIVKAEVHELAFCLGAYLIYMLYKPQKGIVYFILFVLSLFCFLSAFKRIAIIAIAVALVFGYILKVVMRHSKKAARKLVNFLSFFVIFLLIGYVAIIKMNVFELLEEAGINTSGRVGMYQAVDKFYKFSPEFLGNGIGFLTYQLNTSMHIGVASIHNDFLQHFIDLGFWGYIIWLNSMISIRVLYFGRNENVDNAIVTFMLSIYLVIVSSTDNTVNYPLLRGVLAILMMGNAFDENVRNCEYKLFGYVNNSNDKKEGKLQL